MEEEKRAKRQKDQDKKNFQKIGKQAMTRSKKPVVKKNKQVTKELTEEEKDMIKYLQMQ